MVTLGQDLSEASALFLERAQNISLSLWLLKECLLKSDCKRNTQTEEFYHLIAKFWA